jgi:ATP-dependent protease ClpP protease subunit
MAAKIIHIDSYIGRWGYSKELLRFDLEGTQKDGVLLRISSLGGDVFHALDMYNQIAAHGNVEVLFAGPSASAATFLAMSAKRVSIVDNCFLLVHKVMAGVDNYGLFNEDELDTLIADLRMLRSENREFDKAVAHIYAKRTGRTHEQMIAQMKQGTWMSAQKALESGFVDRIVEPEEKVNFRSARFVAMVSAGDLPPFPEGGLMHSEMYACDDQGADSTDEDTNNDTMKQYARINRLLDVPELMATSEGVYLNQGQLELLEQNMEASMQCQANYEAATSERDLARQGREEAEDQLIQAQASIEALTSERDQAVAGRQAAETASAANAAELEALREAFDAIDPTVAGAATAKEKAAAIRTLLARMPGAPAPGILDTRDPQLKADGVDWDLINSLPHNRDIDRNL